MGKECFVCKQEKDISEFYRHPKMADGYMGKCKECHKQHIKEVRERRSDYYRQYDKRRANLPHRVEGRSRYAKSENGKASHAKACERYKQIHPNREAARVIFNNAVRDGKAKRLPCFVCGEKANAHHPDYDRPLDVVWLCPKHHKQAHGIKDEA